MRDENIANVFTFCHSADRQPLRQNSCYVLQTMNGKVDALVEQGEFEFFREQTFIANFGKRGIEDFISRSFDNLNLDFQLRECFLKLILNPVGLPERKLAAAASNNNFVAHELDDRLSSPNKCRRMTILWRVSSFPSSPCPFFKFTIGVWRILFTIRFVRMSSSSCLSGAK